MKLVQPTPPKFDNHTFELFFETQHDPKLVWEWLNTPETFTDTQIFPYKVEFYSPDPSIDNGFNKGVLNVHYGPLINFAGVLTEIRPYEYRDLQYYYGSYAINIRWIRPYRLEFWLEETDNGGTIIKMKLSSWVRPWAAKLWKFFQSLFWGRFKSFLNNGVKALKEDKKIRRMSPA